ncbi:MAG: PilZ domain-containing protein [Proteobacteria bacterium]|nr:PilZ domain-containing protein [Pseudomonadota bacterium]
MTTMESLTEQREDLRRPCFFMAVDYVTDNHVFTESIQDISTNGLFIETRKPLPVGTNINMVFTDYDKLRVIKISGNVIRATSDGIAVKFIFDNQRQETVIQSFVRSI